LADNLPPSHSAVGKGRKTSRDKWLLVAHLPSPLGHLLLHAHTHPGYLCILGKKGVGEKNPFVKRSQWLGTPRVVPPKPGATLSIASEHRKAKFLDFWIAADQI
jgi:hypothetical protein